MKEYIMEYDKVLIAKTENEINSELEISIEFEQKIKKMCDREKGNMKKKKTPVYKSMCKYVASVAILLISVIGIGVITNAATDGKVVAFLEKMTGASMVNDENRMLIGTEVVDDGAFVINGEMEEELGTDDVDRVNLKEQLIAGSHIVNEIDKNMLLPFSIEEIKVIEGVTPEIIMTNGAAVVFYQDDYNGWQCKAGDKLIFDFSKYESAITEEQTFVIGYVLDGVMYNSSEAFRSMEGRYELQIEKDGEYFVYLISATSDYLTMKEGEIRVNKGLFGWKRGWLCDKI